MTVRKGIWYLGSPYSHPDPAVREKRYIAACKAAAKIMQTGQPVFAPIPHSHPIEQHYDKPLDLEHWMEMDLPLLECATKLVVLRLPGWKKSKGLAREIKEAEAIGMPVEFIDP